MFCYTPPYQITIRPKAPRTFKASPVALRVPLDQPRPRLTPARLRVLNPIFDKREGSRMAWRNSGKRRWAYHEAGRAVAARKLGAGIAYDTVVTTDTYHINVLQARPTVELPSEVDSLRISLMVAVAGMAALSLAGYSVDDTREIKHPSDRDIALGCAAYLARIEAGLPMHPTDEEIRELEPGNPLHDAAMVIFDRACDATVALLDANWSAVVHVADALNKGNPLTQVELDQIIARGQRGPQQ